MIFCRKKERKNKQNAIVIMLYYVMFCSDVINAVVCAMLVHLIMLASNLTLGYFFTNAAI